MIILRVYHLQRSTFCGSPAFKIHASDNFFISRWNLLLHDQLVLLENFSLVVQICRLELDVIVRELFAVVAEADNPRRLYARSFRTEFRMRDHDVARRIRPAQVTDETVAVLPNAENNDNADKNEASRDDPLPRLKELQH